MKLLFLMLDSLVIKYIFLMLKKYNHFLRQLYLLRLQLTMLLKKICHCYQYCKEKKSHQKSILSDTFTFLVCSSKKYAPIKECIPPTFMFHLNKLSEKQLLKGWIVSLKKRIIIPIREMVSSRD